MLDQSADSLEAAKLRLKTAILTLEEKLAGQSSELARLNSENDHLKNLLETQAASMAALKKDKDKDSRNDTQELLDEIATLKAEKETIKKRLDQAINSVEHIINASTDLEAGE